MKDILSTAIFSNKEAENFPQKLAGKFSKTLTKTLRRLSDLMSDDPSDIDKPEWEKRVHKLRVSRRRHRRGGRRQTVGTRQRRHRRGGRAARAWHEPRRHGWWWVTVRRLPGKRARGAQDPQGRWGLFAMFATRKHRHQQGPSAIGLPRARLYCSRRPALALRRASDRALSLGAE